MFCSQIAALLLFGVWFRHPEHLVRFHFFKFLDNAAGPDNLNFTCQGVRSKSEVNWPQTRRGVAHTRCLVVVTRRRRRYYLDARPNAIAVTGDSMEREIEPVTWIRAAIYPQLRRKVHGRDDHVGAAVGVQVAECASTMARRGSFGEAGFFRQWLPLALFECPKYRVLLLCGGAGRLGGRDVATGHEQILAAVVVKVIKRRAEAGHIHALAPHST